MPIYVKVIEGKGSFTSGFAQGYCEYFDTNNDIVMKGYFAHSQLIGNNNTLINYTDTTFKYYFGNFINNQPDGNVLLYEFNGNGDLLRNIVSSITVNKINAIYSVGELINEISSQPAKVIISIKYKQVATNEFMIEFNLQEI